MDLVCDDQCTLSGECRQNGWGLQVVCCVCKLWAGVTYMLHPCVRSAEQRLCQGGYIARTQVLMRRMYLNYQVLVVVRPISVVEQECLGCGPPHLLHTWQNLHWVLGQMPLL